jgi:putative endonuclease
MGWKLLARNYRCPAGEADIVALDRSTRADRGAETIVFVEVKARTSARHVAPESAVDPRKRRQLARVAEYYLAHHPAEDYAARFDVVAVIAAADGRPEIRHTVDAFTPS